MELLQKLNENNLFSLLSASKLKIFNKKSFFKQLRLILTQLIFIDVTLDSPMLGFMQFTQHI